MDHENGQRTYDVLIERTTIVDGTGKAAFTGSIAIKGEKIAALGKVEGDATTVIDGSGLVTCPGFIDMHNHGDGGIMEHPLAENLIMQGITTILAGNCGASAAPEKDLTFGEWLSKLENSGMSINMAMLVGHRKVRSMVMGEDWRRKARPDEIEEMKKMVEEAMRSGAFGFSGGRDYGTERFADTKEVMELARVVQKYGGIYQPHTKHSCSSWPTDDPEEVQYGLFYEPPIDWEDVWVGRYRGYLEAIEVSRRTGISLHIGHLCTAYKNPQPHPAFLAEAAAKATLVEIIDKPRDEGLDVTFNVIANSESVTAQRPLIDSFYQPRIETRLSWVKEIPKGEFIERLKTKEFRSRLKRLYDSGKIKFSMIHPKEDPYWGDCFTILTCKNKEYEGETVAEIARMRNTDYLETIFDILVQDPETTWVLSFDKRYASSVIPFLEHPVAMPSTDMGIVSVEPKEDISKKPSPHAYGLFADYIGSFVREKGVLSLEKAVQKASFVPAQVLRLKDRGILRPGAYADMIVFDLETIKMKGDFVNPTQPPDGVEYVLVNGTVVYKDKAHTGKKPGKVIRHTDSPKIASVAS